jgi:hypothetical protein
LLHHKLYLDNPVPPIERLKISHGYNLLTADAVRPANALAIRFTGTRSSGRLGRYGLLCPMSRPTRSPDSGSAACGREPSPLVPGTTVPPDTDWRPGRLSSVALLFAAMVMAPALKVL